MVDRIKKDLTLYLNAHQNLKNRILHYFAFLFAFVAWNYLFIDLRVALMLGVLHYLFSWIGHYYFEGNKPASFRYPHIGFYAGFIWFFVSTVELITKKKILESWINKEVK